MMRMMRMMTMMIMMDDDNDDDDDDDDKGLGEGTKIILPLQGTDTYGALLKNIIDVWASDTPLVTP